MNPPSFIEPLQRPELVAKHLSVDVLRLDRMHPVISGNKWFKLEQHLLLAAGAPILTFGGAWSNHLVATAYAAKQAGLPAIGIVRGERSFALSPTLQDATAYGMQLEFISRQHYAEKEQPLFLQQLARRYPGAYIIPEGGGGMPGIRGSEAMVSKINAASYTHILCAVGTGTTFLGLVRAAYPGQEVIGVPVLKGLENVEALIPPNLPHPLLTAEQLGRTRLLPGYHFGGYARHPQPLLDFMNSFYQDTGIPTDIVYTGKLFYAVADSITGDLFPAQSRLLVIHSGGLQGNRSLPPGALNF